MGQSTLTVRFPLRCLQGELLPAIMILLEKGVRFTYPGKYGVTIAPPVSKTGV